MSARHSTPVDPTTADHARLEEDSPADRPPESAAVDPSASTGPEDAPAGSRRRSRRRRDADAAPTEPPPCADRPLTARLEALLLAADRPLSDGRIADLLLLEATLPEGTSARATIAEAVEALNADYDQSGRTFRIESVAGGWRMLTVPELSPVLVRLRGERQHGRLSQAALETLAIIAYRQPLLRADLEAIRGVACGEVLRGLMERRLVRIVGRAEEPGRPMLYGTTREFLQVFGLAGLDDLPQASELRQPSPRKAAAPAPESPSPAEAPRPESESLAADAETTDSQTS